MDEKGIARPTAPVLDEQFFNPLFMTSVCRSMAKAGVKVFPRGLHGASEIFEFVLRTKTQALGTHHDGTPAVYKALLRALYNLAGVMIERQADNVPLNDASALVNAAFETLPIRDQSWLSVLEGSDILRRDVEQPAGSWTPFSAPNEVVRFTFQRLQDQMIAEQLVHECRDIEGAFEPGGPFKFLIRRSVHKGNVPLLKPARQWLGALGALWSAIAERHKKEVWDLRSFFGSPDAEFYPDDLKTVFRASVRERRGDAFTPRTWEILQYLFKEDHKKGLELLLSLSCVPGHAWNADFLAGQVLSMSKAVQGEAWSRHFANEHSRLTERATEIADWVLNVDIGVADEEVLHLAGLTLECLCVAENDALRERVKKGLARLKPKGAAE
jgi:hypothetical protein